VSIMAKARTAPPPATAALSCRGSLCFKPLPAAICCIAVISRTGAKAEVFEVHKSSMGGCT
jgi:hypothetical protein